MKRTLLTLIVILSFYISYTQTVGHPVPCGFDHFIKMKKTHDTEWYRQYQHVMSGWKASRGERGGGSGLYVVPVVFHIVYNTDVENIADSVVLSQMQVLNEDYRRLNANAIDTRAIFEPVAADCEIEFQLAAIDPEGNPTNGITHTFTSRAGFTLDIFSATNTLDEVKHVDSEGVDAWDPEHYLNIWVCNIEPTLFGQIFGLSYPPADLDNWPAGSSAPSAGDDGVIVHYTTVGRNNPNANDDGTEFNNMGRTLTHEVGHYLGLRHTWGDELFTDVCSVDDGMEDTPLCASGDQYECDYEANTCDDGTGDDMPDQLENYMDYTRDECYNMFTEDQRSMMRYVLENPRVELLSGTVLSTEGIKEERFEPYPNPTAEVLNISNAGLLRNANYFIIDGMGRKVLSGMINLNGINVNTLAPGIYFLNLATEKKIVVRTFIKS